MQDKFWTLNNVYTFMTTLSGKVMNWNFIIIYIFTINDWSDLPKKSIMQWSFMYLLSLSSSVIIFHLPVKWWHHRILDWPLARKKPNSVGFTQTIIILEAKSSLGSEEFLLWQYYWKKQNMSVLYSQNVYSGNNIGGKLCITASMFWLT